MRLETCSTDRAVLSNAETLRRLSVCGVYFIADFFGNMLKHNMDYSDQGVKVLLVVTYSRAPVNSAGGITSAV